MLRYDAVALPALIQGGMGMAVSSWRLASAVSPSANSASSRAPEWTRCWLGGCRTATSTAASPCVVGLPCPQVATRLIERYLPRRWPRAGGEPYTPVPARACVKYRHARNSPLRGLRRGLARQAGPRGPVGVNYLEKIQMATAAGAYGAMLAGVDHVLMGAGSRARSRTCSTAWPRARAGDDPRGRPRRHRAATASASTRPSVRRRACRCSRGRSSSRSSRPTPSRRTWPATRRPGPTGSSWKAPSPAATTLRRAAGWCSTTRANRLRPARRREPRPPGRAGPAVLAGRFVRNAGQGRRGPADRSGRRPGRHDLRAQHRLRPDRPDPGRTAGRARRRDAARQDRPVRLADRVPVQGGRTTGDPGRHDAARGPATALRPGLPAHAVRPRQRRDRLPLPGRTGAHLVRKGGTAEETVGAACLCNALPADIGLGQSRSTATPSTHWSRSGPTSTACAQCSSDIQTAGQPPRP